MKEKVSLHLLHHLINQMKYFSVISLILAVIATSCTKEIITPVQETDEIMNTRGSSRNPENCDGENGGITDPDNESDEEKVRNKKKKAK